jgi:hypothetical protein
MKLLELRLLPERTHPVKAFADIELDDGTIIREFRVVQEPKRLPTVGNPQISWKDPADGRIKYKVIVTLPKPVKNEVDLLILGKWMGAKENHVAAPTRPV